jgi:hypothetical protein
MWTPVDFQWAVSANKTYWVTLLWSASRCVFFVWPNTLLLCIFLFCTFLLYHTDPQVEVQIRILLKDKYGNCVEMQTPAITVWFPVNSFYKNFLLGYFILQKQLANQGIFLMRSELSITAYLFLALYGSTALQSQLFLKNIDNFLCK